LAKFAKFAPFALKSSSVTGLKIAITYKVTTILLFAFEQPDTSLAVTEWI